MEDVAVLILRLVVGALFVGHGAQKLFGWFGGHGLKGTGGFMESLGVRPGVAAAALVGLSELVGGVLLVAGFLLPLAAVLIGGVMVGAIATVHGKNGLWADRGGYEYNLVLIVVVAALAVLGPGVISLAGTLGVAGMPIVGNIL